MRESMVAGLVIAASLMSFVSEARAERYIIVNGQRMTLPQIAQLERIACTPIPNGNYWLNTTTGVWGYAGNTRPQGNIRDGCYRQVRRPSLSERGMLFTPYDWVRD
jgi:hypothetical protein